MEGATNSDFEYPLLDSQIPSIRLLRIEGLESELQLLRCSLNTATLDGIPPFCALSYTWGNPLPDYSTYDPVVEDWESSSCAILCNGQVFSVRQNLYDALLQIHATRPSGYLWIDAICINQLDTQERGHQVALMGSIYTRATSVIVWLGRSDPELEKFHFLHMLLCPALDGLIQREGLEKACTVYLEDSTILEQLGFSADIAAQLSIPPPSLEHWKAYAKFYERRFFQRAWIVQELALARGIAVLCGEIELDWTAMMMIQYFVVKSQWGSYLSSADRITSNDGTPGGKLSYLDTMNRIYSLEDAPSPTQRTLRRNLQNMCGASSEIEMAHAALLYQLIGIRRFEATDLRDKIYGVLGMVARFLPSSADSLIRPDYTMTVKQVYQTTASLLIQNLPFLAVLSLKDDSNVSPDAAAKRTVPDLPSWVPDFSLHEAYSNQRPYAFRANGSFYDASRCTGSPVLPREINNNILTLQAALIERIEEPTPYLGPVFKFDVLVNIIWLCNALPLTYPNGQDRVEALWRTLIGDEDGTTSPAPIELGNNFFTYILLTIRKQTHDDRQLDIEESMIYKHIKYFERLSITTKAACGFPSFRNVRNQIEREKQICGEEHCTQGDSDGPHNHDSWSRESLAKVQKRDDFLKLERFSQRRAFRTKSGLLGLGPIDSREGGMRCGS